MVVWRVAHKNNIKLLICSVYLPSTTNTIGKFKDKLDSVESFCLQYSKKNQNLVVLGDFNADLGDFRSLNSV